MVKARIPKVGFVSLGCSKNLVDSERIVTALRAEGYKISSTYDDSDIVVVNTCGFIDSAIDESLAAIGEALYENGKVIVTGCLGARQEAGKNFISARYPSLLGVVGPGETQQTLDLIHANLPPPHEPFGSLVPKGGILLTPPHYAYLKIAEGCNHGCTFCIIPSLRGKLVSRPIGKIMREAENLVKDGVKELIVIAQDTAAYGSDVRYKLDFIGGRAVKTKINVLFEELSKLGVWVRPHYVYPYLSVDDWIPLMAEGKILPYLDVPFQHAHPRILKAMKRPGSENNLERIEAWRKACPDLTIRSTFITGFPGETEEEFQYLLDFLKEAKLDAAGCFAYSPVEGAAANALPGMLPEEVREERRWRLMRVQEEISKELLQKKIGRKETVIVDGIDREHDVAIARSKAQSPEVDGVIYIQDNPKVKPGDFAEVEIVEADSFDLYADLV
ncbi:MAG: 30S ribosomal protein S12 methylthiotransferase RimO [Burkholderiales bacterium]|nr:30S ribosomal protein S12 methylthiotransferase RimO [Burkholderiales bacterium]